MPNVPKDPLWNSSLGNNAGSSASQNPSYATGNTNFYYAYDPVHAICDPTLSIHRLETSGAQNKFAKNDTLPGGEYGVQMDVPNSDYVYCPIPGVRTSQ